MEDVNRIPDPGRLAQFCVRGDARRDAMRRGADGTYTLLERQRLLGDAWRIAYVSPAGDVHVRHISRQVADQTAQRKRAHLRAYETLPQDTRRLRCVMREADTCAWLAERIAEAERIEGGGHGEG